MRSHRRGTTPPHPLRPRPAEPVADRPEPAPADAQAPEPPPAVPGCAEALTWVEESGLQLPANVEYECPSTRFSHHGAACWDEWPCPGVARISINLDLIGGAASPEYLRHVVAHEVCHILDFRLYAGPARQAPTPAPQPTGPDRSVPEGRTN